MGSPVANSWAVAGATKTTSLVIRHGYIVAELGDTTKVDPTYSAAKGTVKLRPQLAE